MISAVTVGVNDGSFKPRRIGYATTIMGLIIARWTDQRVLQLAREMTALKGFERTSATR